MLKFMASGPHCVVSNEFFIHGRPMYDKKQSHVVALFMFCFLSLSAPTTEASEKCCEVCKPARLQARAVATT